MAITKPLKMKQFVKSLSQQFHETKEAATMCLYHKIRLKNDHCMFHTVTIAKTAWPIRSSDFYDHRLFKIFKGALSYS